MPNRPLRPCRYPGCGRLVSSGYCPEHKPLKAARRVSAQWHGWYNLPVWTKQLRPNQLMREPFCRECARHGKRVQATVVDHITPFRGDWALFRAGTLGRRRMGGGTRGHAQGQAFGLTTHLPPALEKFRAKDSRPHGLVHAADSPHGDAGAGGSEKTAYRHPAGPIGRRKMCPSWTPTRE